MKEMRADRKGEHGGTLLEFAVTATFYFMMLIGIVSISHVYFTHNGLVESTRRGARYATLVPDSSDTAIKNVVVYGTASPADGARPLVYGLDPDTNVVVSRSFFGVGQGYVTVKIESYNYAFVIPGLRTVLPMPEYRTTLTGESAGFVPADIN